eukprot:GHVL01011265.1.p2 GENE.GHVL01011265.1~~GHVL01011265.1.p2  ORF type:complete len:500 (-),score=134.67 GHVL01011265.1:1835-3133(-)
MRSRSSSDIPRKLPSRFVEDEENEKRLEREEFSKKPELHEISQHFNVEKLLPTVSEITKLAIAQADDKKHKYYKMTYSPEGAIAIVALRYPAMYASLYRILYEISKRCINFKPTSLLEYSAGAAPGTIAAQHIFPDSFNDILCVEESKYLSQIGEYLTCDYPSVYWQSCLYDNIKKYDIVICAWKMMEMNDQDSRNILIKKLWNRVNTGGVLILLEKGTPTGFRYMHVAREIFIGDLGSDKFHFIAPCPHESVCPFALTGRDWCHFSQKWLKLPHPVYRLGSKAKTEKEERFSYLSIRKGPGPRSLYYDENEAPTVEEKSYFWPRLVSPPILSGRHVLMDVCSRPNNFQRISATKCRPHSFGYQFARNSMWGDLWHFSKKVDRLAARQYIPEKSQDHIERIAKKANDARNLKMNTAYKGIESRSKSFYGDNN